MRRARIVIFAGALFCTAFGARTGTFDLPLTQTNGWQFLKYHGLPPNTFQATPDGLVIGVTNSAAPLVLPFTNGLHITEIRVLGTIAGSLKVAPAKQGEKGFDDYTLRVGLVEPGRRTLSWWETMTAADWVKQLFALAPPGTGVGKIRFFNLGTAPSQIGRKQIYSTAIPMEQTVVAVPDEKGDFSLTHRFATPVPVIAIWIACDGDDTHSSFAVTIRQAELTTTNESTSRRAIPITKPGQYENE